MDNVFSSISSFLVIDYESIKLSITNNLFLFLESSFKSDLLLSAHHYYPYS